MQQAQVETRRDLHPAADALRRALRSLIRNPAGLFGLIVILVVVAVAVGAPYIAPHDPVAQSIFDRLKPPFSEGRRGVYWLGSDGLGQDVLSRVIYGARISLFVGVASMLGAGCLGTVLGLLAGFFGGRVDAFIMRLVDIQLSVPFLVLALALMAVLGPGLDNIIIALTITGWPAYARIVRAESMVLRRTEFVEAATALGAGRARIIFRHLLPNLASSLTVVGTLEIGRMILTEASLSYLGAGIPPPTPTWGGMVADGQAYVYSAWWVTAMPGAALFLTVLGINLFGDWLRDFLDPRSRTRV